MLQRQTLKQYNTAFDKKQNKQHTKYFNTYAPRVLSPKPNIFHNYDASYQTWPQLYSVKLNATHE